MENFATNSLIGSGYILHVYFTEEDYSQGLRRIFKTKEMKKSSVYDCHVLPLSKIHNPAGNITIVEGTNNIPFNIRRIYYLYDIPGGESRGGHAHKELVQLIVAAVVVLKFYWTMALIKKLSV
jgi:hypothetical protein